MSESLLTLDKRAVSASFSRAADRYDEVASLQQLVGDEIVHRLTPSEGEASALDIGCGTGYLIGRLVARGIPVTGLDLASGMLLKARQAISGGHWVQGDAESLPFGPGSFSLVVSNFALQWCGNLPAVFADIARVLVPGGKAWISLPAEGTLCELDASWKQADTSRRHVNTFPSVANIAVTAADAGFRVQTALELQRRVNYRAVSDLTRDLKILGAHNVQTDRAKTLTSKGTYQRMVSAYETLRSEQGMLPATWRIGMFGLERP